MRMSGSDERSISRRAGDDLNITRRKGTRESQYEYILI
jgi:hypothetical protein